MKISNFKLGIGLPLSFHMVPRAFFESFLTMEKPDFTYIAPLAGDPFDDRQQRVDAMRNTIVMDARDAGCSHLLMMDTDQVYDVRTVPRLLSHKVPVVGPLIFRRYPPFDPLMFRGEIGKYLPIDDWLPGDLVSVDATGSGCLLFDMRVFRQVSPPWFRTSIRNGKPVGEDFGFCSVLRGAGFPIYVDTSIPAGHLSQLQITEGTWRLYRNLKQAEAARSNGGAKAPTAQAA